MKKIRIFLVICGVSLFGLTSCEGEECADADGDGFKAVACGGTDCDDDDANRYPGNAEVCDSQDHDEDCDPTTFGIQDLDGDGHGDSACCNVAADGTEHCGDDCDDGDASALPGAAESCDETDNDCDGEVDEGVQSTYYRDGDDDGYGSDASNIETVQACAPPSGFVAERGDCDDDDALVNPLGTEVCDGIDNDCDGATDTGCACVNGETLPCGTDTGECSRGSQLCSSGVLGPCDGGVTAAPEICDGLDNDCDGVDDNGVTNTYYRDSDTDGYGDPSLTIAACTLPEGWVVNSTDCDDSDTTVHPGAVELCDRLDTDCNEGGGQRAAEDSDDDGYAPLGTVLCSGGTRPQTDCNDNNGDFRPDQTAYFGTGYCGQGSLCASLGCCVANGTPCTAGNCLAPASFDYNCDLADTPAPSSFGCLLMVGFSNCEGDGPIYAAGSPPACGALTTYRTCTFSGAGGDHCEEGTTTEPMGCH